MVRPDLIAVANSPTPSTVFYGSPDVFRCGNGDLIVRADEFGAGAHSDGTDWDRCKLYRSTNDGLTWTLDQDIDGIFWGGFLPDLGDGNVYILGTSRRYGSPSIAKSSDYGATWNISQLIDGTGLYYHTAPTPAIIKSGRIYKGFERNDSSAYPIERLFVLHADITSDLTNSASWTASAEISRASFTPPGSWGTWGWSESNMVELPNGSLELFVRCDVDVEKNAIARVPFDGTALGTPRFVSSDGGYVKFQIRHDSTSGDYFCARNSDPVNDGADRRTLLVLDRSSDLVYWRRVAILAEAPVAGYEDWGYQYPSLAFDGDDVMFAIRTAIGGIAPNEHDSNQITFARIENFRSL